MLLVLKIYMLIINMLYCLFANFQQIIFEILLYLFMSCFLVYNQHVWFNNCTVARAHKLANDYRVSVCGHRCIDWNFRCLFLWLIRTCVHHILCCVCLSLVLLWQLSYLFCSSIVINTVIVTAGNFEPPWKGGVWRFKILFNPPFL